MIGQNEIFIIQTEILNTLYCQRRFGKQTLIYNVGADPACGKGVQGSAAPQSKSCHWDQEFQNRQHKERGAPENGITEIDEQRCKTPQGFDKCFHS